MYMHFLSAFALLLQLLPACVFAQATAPTSPSPYTTGVVGDAAVAGNGTGPDADGKWHLEAEGIRAYFIPYGASISNLFINDTNGIERDLVLGFDNATHYTDDTSHPHLGGVPGRYANRIKNSTFDIDGQTYHILPDENNGTDTLHGGPDGWDWRNWTVVAHTTDSITFSLADMDGDQGFPGEVVAFVTYTLTPYTWNIRMNALALTKTTPIMLSSHTYWNLDGFQNPDTNLILNHTLSLPYSGQRVGCDGNLIPTGDILANQPYSVNDFRTTPKQIGANFTSPDLLGNCGTGCTGYDTCFLVNRDAAGNYDWTERGPVASLSSDFSGIKVDIFTDQDAFQVYSCGGMNGSMPLKNTQGFFNDTAHPRIVPQYGCVVMEVEDWIDGINQPEWGRAPKQIFGPSDAPYVLQAQYRFSVDDCQEGADYGYGGMARRT